MFDGLQDPTPLFMDYKTRPRCSVVPDPVVPDPVVCIVCAGDCAREDVVSYTLANEKHPTTKHDETRLLSR